MNTKTLIKLALKEDKAQHDITTLVFVPRSRRISGDFIAKESGIVCGLDIAAEAFKALDKKITFKKFVKDGIQIKKFQKLASISGNARAILSGERTALNILQRMSGIATLTHKYVVAACGKTRIYDTRKTTPLLREFEKYAVRCGGGFNHRFDLAEMALVKDNHLAAVEDWGSAVKQLRVKYPRRHLEIEAQSLKQVSEIVKLKPDIIMLDNMNLADMKKAITYIRKNSVCEIEISGGMNIDSVKKYATLRPDRISVGKITHSAPSIDISLEFR